MFLRKSELLHCTVQRKRIICKNYLNPPLWFSWGSCIVCLGIFFWQNISFRDENLLCSSLTLHFPVFPWTGDLKKLGDSHHGPKIVLDSHLKFCIMLSEGMLVVLMRSDLFVSLFNFDKQAKLDSALRACISNTIKNRKQIAAC